MIRQESEKARADGDSDNRKKERTPWKCFICGSEDHLIAKYPKEPKDNDKRRNQARFNEKGDCACDNGKNNSDKKIYAYIWNVCLVITNVLVENLVTVHN